MHRKTKVCTGLIVAFGGSLAIGSLPAHAQQSLERVEITGSAIKRVQTEGPAPVEIYTRKDIERTGATTVTELVKNLAALDIDDQGDLTGNSPSGSGTTNLQIRGLSERNLLVLLNGRRLPVNALHDGSGAGAAVDVNSIPISVIERIEVLKDGGSAIYGADAVAGVINFITRKNYTGVEARLGYGISSRGDAKEVPAGIVFGYGDYDTQGFNFLGALDFFKRDAIPRTERDITSSANWTRFDNGNGRDGRSGFHPSANILDGPGAGGQLAPCPPEDLNASGSCRFDFSRTILESTNAADRWSAMGIGSVKLGDAGRGFVEVTYSESNDLFLAQPAPGNLVIGSGATAQTIAARFMQPGPRTTDRKSTLLNTVIGAEGTVGKVDWDVAIGQGTSKVTNQDSNYLATDRFLAAINAGLIDPTSTTNPTAVVDAARLTPRREGKSVVRFANGKLGGQIMELGGGPLAYAVGLQAQKETLNDQPDADQQAGNVFGSIAQGAVSAERKSHAVFGELSIPAFKNFESQVALRYDKYPDTSRTSPKLAAKYQPFNSFLVRGSYAGSFLAPSLKQLYGGQEQGAESVSTDAQGNVHPVCTAFPTLSGDCDNFPYQEISGSNPNLKPEIGKTYNLGFVFEPVPQASLGVDFWWIEKKDEISTLSVESAAANGAIGISPQGEAQVFVTNLNVASTKLSGLDLDGRLRFADTPLGRITVANKATIYTKNDKQFEPNGPFLEYNGTFLYPKWRNNFNINFETGPWSTTFNMRTTSSMKDTDQPKGEVEYENARDIGSHTEVDGLVQYAGFKGLTLTGGVKNIFDRMPPYSNEGTQNQYGSLGFPWIYSPRGRFFFVTANYKFY